MINDKPSLDALAHYGVKGMKWGVRRFEYKPVGRKSKASTKKSQEDNLEEQESTQKKKLSKKQKVAIAGAAIVAAYATYKLVDSGAYRELINAGKKFVQNSNNSSPFKKDNRLASKDFDAGAIHTMVVNGINPNYGAVGTKNNCLRCTYAYELRRRGYDVAATKSVRGSGQSTAGTFNALKNTPVKLRGGTNALSLIVGNLRYTSKTGEPSKFVSSVLEAKGKSIDNSGDIGKSIFDTLSKQPNGSRGNLNLYWKAGGGHSIAYEIIKGKPVIFDCQTGEMLDNLSKFKKYADRIDRANFTRLDNLDLDLDYLTRWIKNA